MCDCIQDLCVWACLYEGALVEVRRQLDSIFSWHLVSAVNQTQVFRLGNKCLYLLSHLASHIFDTGNSFKYCFWRQCRVSLNLRQSSCLSFSSVGFQVLPPCTAVRVFRDEMLHVCYFCDTIWCSACFARSFYARADVPDYLLQSLQCLTLSCENQDSPGFLGVEIILLGFLTQSLRLVLLVLRILQRHVLTINFTQVSAQSWVSHWETYFFFWSCCTFGIHFFLVCFHLHTNDLSLVFS